MTKPKTLEQLRAEKEQVETQLAQEQHKLERLENRKKFLEQGERKKRTHRLCNLGGTIESLAPEVKDLTRTEMTELMEYIFSLPEVQRAVRHMAITHINQASRGKEQKLDPDTKAPILDKDGKIVTEEKEITHNPLGCYFGLCVGFRFPLCKQ